MKKIYLASPLFSLAERNFNIEFVNKIRQYTPDYEFVLPQERAEKLLSHENGNRLVFEDCLAMITESDVVVAILDGSDADSGTCVELGYAYAKKIPVIGVRTDFRASEENGLNLMVTNLCYVLIRRTNSDLDQLSKEVAQVLSGIKT